MSVSAAWTVLVPLRDLGGGKTRLAGVLSAAERRALTCFAAGAVVSACRTAPSVARVVVVSGSDEASDWARSVGAEGWRQPAEVSGLSRAMEAALSAHSATGQGVALVMGDLPLASTAGVERCLLRAAASPVTLVPSRSGAGTNLLAFAQGGTIELSLGAADSLVRHRLAARRAGLRVQTVRAATLALDVDEAADLTLLARSPAARAALPFLARF